MKRRTSRGYLFDFRSRSLMNWKRIREGEENKQWGDDGAADGRFSGKTPFRRLRLELSQSTAIEMSCWAFNHTERDFTDEWADAVMQWTRSYAFRLSRDSFVGDGISTWEAESNQKRVHKLFVCVEREECVRGKAGSARTMMDSSSWENQINFNHDTAEIMTFPHETRSSCSLDITTRPCQLSQPPATSLLLVRTKLYHARARSSIKHKFSISKVHVNNCAALLTLIIDRKANESKRAALTY